MTVPRKDSKLARKFARCHRVELLVPRVRLDRDPVIYELGPLDPAIVNNPTLPPSPVIEVEQFGAEVEVKTEADLAESQTSGSAEGEVAENNHPRSSLELGLMGLCGRHRLMSLCDPPLPSSPTLPTQAGHDPLIENHDKPEPMDSLDIPLPIGPPSEDNIFSLSGSLENLVVEPDINLDAVLLERYVDAKGHPAVDEIPAPQPQVVHAEVHEPPPDSRTPPPLPELDVVGSPSPAAPAPADVEIIVVSDDEAPADAAPPVIELADSPPPAPEPMIVIDLVANAAPAVPAALRTPPVSRRTPQGPPRRPHVPDEPRCFNCHCRGHLGKYCPYPPMVGRPCFNCGLQGHKIVSCPTPQPFATDNRLSAVERQQRLQADQLRRLRVRRRLFQVPYSYAHQQMPPVAMWLGPQYPYLPQPPAPVGWAYQVPRWQVPHPYPAIAYPLPPNDPEFSEPEAPKKVWGYNTDVTKIHPLHCLLEFGRDVAVLSTSQPHEPGSAPIGGDKIIKTSKAAVFVLWAPPDERARLVVISGTGAYLGAALNYPLSGFLANKYGWESIFYAAGGLTLIWSVIWFIFVSNDPTKDQLMMQEERDLFKRNISETYINKKKDIPWKTIFTSKPVWAYCNEFFSFYWAQSFLVYCLPLYVKDFYNVNIQDIGLISGIPIMAGFMGNTVACFASDYLRSHTSFSKPSLHRIFIAIGQIFFVIGLIYCGMWANFEQSIICLSLARLMAGTTEVSYLVLAIDMFSEFAGIIRGFGVTATSIANFLNPIVMGFMVADHSRSSWNLYFLFLSIFNIWSLIIYYMYGSGELQEWATPSTTEKEIHENKSENVCDEAT
ncbi:hypothetical protein V9T40_002738 [Parthenolecanium corni]|uniref:CCHC-type domain-containing protein n=1 Tax=Parthenolecanium corni TaxID=536013 RepID=A0AAN9TH96_9HEMI